MKENKITKKYIEDKVMEYYNIDYDMLHERSNRPEVLEPKKFIWLFCRELTKLSYVEIGEGYKGCTHGNVIQTTAKFEGWIETNVKLKKKYDEIKELITKTKEERFKSIFVKMYGENAYKLFMHDKKYQDE